MPTCASSHRNVLDDGGLRRVGVDRIGRWIDAANDACAPSGYAFA